MKVINAIKLMRTGKIVGEKALGITIYRIQNNEVYYKTLSYPWAVHGKISDFNKKFHNEIFEEIVLSKEHGLGYTSKKD